MNIVERENWILITAESYVFRVNKANFTGILSLPEGNFHYYLPLRFACTRPGEIDFSLNRSACKLSGRADSAIVSFSEKTSLWEKKEIELAFSERQILAAVRVFGSGTVDRIYFFRGFENGREYGCAPGFDRIFTASPNFHEKIYFHPSDYLSIDAFITEFAGGACLASPYYFYSLNNSGEQKWVGAGPVAEPGENLFDSFEMNPKFHIGQTQWPPDNQLGGGFSLAYNGHLPVRDEYRFPGLLLTFGESEWDTLRKHVEYQRAMGMIPEPHRNVPEKWLEPIFCGWHEQGVTVDFGAARDDQAGADIFDVCTEENHLKWLDILEKNNCRPGSVIVDAKWQIDTGNNVADPRKFPDMRRFIEGRHRNRQLVFLWHILWTKEGVPAAECILKNGEPLAGDPTNPAHEARIRNWVRRMFSSDRDGYNADGIKIDGMLAVPGGGNLQMNKAIYGLELQKYILSIIHDEAKKHKRDAVISVFSAHPYLGDVIDMVRIGDMFTVKASCQDTMLHRSQIYKTLLPGVPIDTDGQFAHNIIEDWRTIFARQAQIGIPTLYCATAAKRHRFFGDAVISRFTPEDYLFFADVLEKYRSSRVPADKSRRQPGRRLRNTV